MFYKAHAAREKCMSKIKKERKIPNPAVWHLKARRQTVKHMRCLYLCALPRIHLHIGWEIMRKIRMFCYESDDDDNQLEPVTTSTLSHSYHFVCRLSVYAWKVFISPPNPWNTNSPGWIAAFNTLVLMIRCFMKKGKKQHSCQTAIAHIFHNSNKTAHSTL